MKKKKSNVVWIIVLLLTLIIFYTCHYFNINFGGVYFEQLLYTVVNSEGTSINALIDGIKYVSIYSLISFIILLVIIFLDRKYLVNKYILMSLVINTLLGYVYSLLNKNLSFKLERVNNEKEEK